MQHLELKILVALYKRTKMTRTDIYKLFHRFTAEEKNASLARLLKNKHILKDEKINIKNGKIVSIFTISEYGENLIESKVYN